MVVIISPVIIDSHTLSNPEPSGGEQGKSISPIYPYLDGYGADYDDLLTGMVTCTPFVSQICVTSHSLSITPRLEQGMLLPLEMYPSEPPSINTD